MNKPFASGKKLPDMRRKTFYNTAIPFLLTTISFVSNAQQISNNSLENDKKAILSIAYFTESANNSINSLNGLLKKDNYRNKITTLNNPANNELGFSLKTEILEALKPLLDKVRKTDKSKFKEVIENFLNNPEENGIKSVKKYLPALGIFSTVLSLVGNLVIIEKKITQQDLNIFIEKIQQYFTQYEKLNSINMEFTLEVNRLLDKSEEIKSDLKDFLIECITSLDRKTGKDQLKGLPMESLLLKYYDPQKLQQLPDSLSQTVKGPLFPPDAPTSVKILTSGIKKLQKEFETLYSENYKQLKELIGSLKSAIPNLDEKQLDKTNAEIDRLYSESKQADLTNLNISQVDERMNTACRIINNYK